MFSSSPLPLLASNGLPVLPPLFVVLFVWLSLALGRRLLVVLGAPRGGSLGERGVVAVCLGAGTLQFAPFALGVIGLLSPLSLRSLVGAIALLLVKDLWAVAARGLKALRSPTRPKWWLLAWAGGLFIALAVQVPLALTPTIDADGVIYHLTVPKRWLESGSLLYLPTYPYSNTPMGVEMLYASSMAFAGDAAAKCLHLVLGVFGTVGLYLAGRRLHSPVVGALAATVFLVGPIGVVAQLGTAYIEGATAFALAASTVAWLVWLHEREPSWLRCAALLAGIGVSFKMTSALFPIALGVLTLIVLRCERRPDGGPLRRALTTMGPAFRLAPLVLLPVLPWLIRSALVTGNPVFPLLAEWIPSRDMSPASAAQFELYNRYLLWGTNVGAMWSLEQRKLALLAIGGVVTLAVGLVATRLRSPVGRATALVFLGTVIAQMYALGLYARYWIPLLAVLLLPMLLLIRKPLSARWVPAVLVIATLFLSVQQARRSLAGFDLNALLRTSIGVDDRRTFITRYQYLFPMFERVNRELPPDARILMTTYCSGFYVDRTTFCMEFVQDSLRFTTWDEFTADLRHLGITYVIAPVAPSTGGPNAAPPMRGSVAMIDYQHKRELVSRLIKEQGRLVAQAADQGLYEVGVGVSAQAH